MHVMTLNVLLLPLQVQVIPTISHRLEVCISSNMAVIGKFAKTFRRKHYARRAALDGYVDGDTLEVCISSNMAGKFAKTFRRKHYALRAALDGDVDGDTCINLEGILMRKPTSHIELDDDLREYYAECASTACDSDLNMYLHVRVLCVMWIRSLIIKVRVLFSDFSL